ncbi:MAG TPA: thioesterase family protein [Anaerolineales bacterium]|nr:thioesterase family protein [Anaerolineales bacterium]
MPIAHSRTFRVRSYECDPYGHVNNVTYLRYMQEAAFDAAAAVGYGPRWYETSGHAWLVRETDIEYLRPLRYGDSVAVKTWVEDFRRTRSRRAYEMTKEPGGEAVARATTDWVYVDAATGRPATVPSDMAAAFGLSPDQESAPRPKFPAAPPPPPGAFRMRRQVQWREIDAMMHVNNAVYMDYVSDCGMQVINAHGWTAPRMIEAGFGIVVRRHQIEYKQSALLDEELEIATWVSGVRRATANRHYVIHRVRDGALLAQVHSYCVWIDLKTSQPVRIPPDFISAFAPNIVNGS